MTSPKKRESNPKLMALGWDKLDPDKLVDRTVQRIKKASEEAKRLAECPAPEPAEPAGR